MSSALEIVKSENVLHFVVSVENGPVSVGDALFNLGHEELLHVVRLLVAKQSCQILPTFIYIDIDFDKIRNQMLRDVLWS